MKLKDANNSLPANKLLVHNLLATLQMGVIRKFNVAATLIESGISTQNTSQQRCVDSAATLFSGWSCVAVALQEGIDNVSATLLNLLATLQMGVIWQFNVAETLTESGISTQNTSQQRCVDSAATLFSDWSCVAVELQEGIENVSATLLNQLATLQMGVSAARQRCI